MTDPLNLLKNKLKEIDEVDCQDNEFINYRSKYYSTIRFLELNGFFTKDRKDLNEFEIAYIKMKKGKFKRPYLARILGVSIDVIQKVLIASDKESKEEVYFKKLESNRKLNNRYNDLEEKFIKSKEELLKVKKRNTMLNQKLKTALKRKAIKI